MFSTERRFFFSTAAQKELINEDLPETEFQSDTQLIRTVPVRLRFFKLTASGSRWIGAQREITYDGEPILVRESRDNFWHTTVKFRRRRLTQLLASKLSTMGVPDDEQPAILRKTIQVAQVAVPGVPISVIIVDVTVRLAPSIAMIVDLFRIVTSFADVNYQLIIDGVAWEFMEEYAWQFKTIPAAKSSIEDLDKLRLDCLEEATIRQASRCVICLEDFDLFDAHVQEEEDQPLALTCLPCSHIYHRECVVRWLETCHFCPLCHYPMPTEEPPAPKARTVEAGELPKPSWKDHWRLMLMVSHRVITVTLVCRLLSSQDVLICSSMLSTKRNFYVSRATQRELINEHLPNTEDINLTVPIRLRFFKLIGSGSRWIGALREIAYDGEPILIGEKRSRFQHSLIKSTGRRFREWVAKELARMGVPDNEQPAIIRKVVQVVEVAVPRVPISVIIVDVTVRLNPIIAMLVDLFRWQTVGDDVDYEVIIDMVTWETMETYVWRFRSTPATKSSIEGLEKLRLDSLEEDTIRQASPCVICLEHLDHFNTNAEEGIDGDHPPTLVTRLPCLHLYHRGCIVRWLETSHLCPLCHYQMPTEEAGELAEPSWQLDWTMLLMVTSGGILAATLLCRLLKRSYG